MVLAEQCQVGVRYGLLQLQEVTWSLLIRIARRRFAVAARHDKVKVC